MSIAYAVNDCDPAPVIAFSRRRSSSGGFSLLEALISLSIGVVFLSSVVSTWYFSSKMFKEQSLKTKLYYQVESAMEKIKKDISLSDGNGILFYPQDASTYTAISLPAADPDANGFLTFSSGAIAWNKTIIYHVYQVGAKQEFRRTVYSSYQTNAATRQTQLDAVVSSGQGAAGAATRMLFSAEGASLAITPEFPTFDGYRSSVSLSEILDFGSITLAPGSHTIRFEVTGKNSASSGYAMGLDTISLAPSGGTIEMESLLPETASSGDAVTKEYMPPTGIIWGGNHQLAYSSNAVADYVTVQLNYDMWRESNFSNFSRSYVSIDGTDPYLTIESREAQSLSSAWQAEAQTAASLSGSASIPDKTVRAVISGSLISLPSNMIRFKFLASTSNALTVSSAFFGLRSGSTGNFNGAPAQLYFNNGTVAEGTEDGVGAMGALGPTSITIPAGKHAWSNWFEYSMDPSIGVPDFLVSYAVPNDPLNAEAALWTASDLLAVNAYTVDGSHASDMTDFSTLAGYTAVPSTYGVQQLAAWSATGTATSQIYDTKMTAPAYNQVVWNYVLPVGSSIRLKVRSSADPAMVGATDWSLITGSTLSPATLSAVPNKKYVQFQATLTAVSPYTSLPQADNITIDWPGQTALVELSGTITRKSNYGKFKILVDGLKTVKALETKLTAQETYRGKVFDYSLSAEVRPKNTGK